MVEIVTLTQINDRSNAQELRNEAILEERRKLAKTVGHSDHVLLSAVFQKWCESGGGEKRRFCDRLGIADNGMREMKQLRDQLDGSLRGIGFRNNANSNRNGTKWRVVRGCVVSALSPAGLARVERSSAKYSETKGGAVEKDGEARELKFFVPKNVKELNDDAGDIGTEKESRGGEPNNNNNPINNSWKPRTFNGVGIERVFVHPSSINFGGESNYIKKIAQSTR